MIQKASSGKELESSSWNKVVELVVFVFVVGFTDEADEEELIVIADWGETGFSNLLVVGSDLTFEVCFVVVVVVDVDVDVDAFRWFCFVGVVVVVVVVCFFADTVLLLLVMDVFLVMVVGRVVVFVDVVFLANCRFDPSPFDVSFSWR